MMTDVSIYTTYYDANLMNPALGKYQSAYPANYVGYVRYDNDMDLAP
jgi:hypothetical protein